MFIRQLATALLAGLGLTSSGLLLATLLQGCSSDAGESTSGRRVVLHTRVTVDEAARSRFTTALGWEVELSQAAIAAGPFYYFDGAPPLALGSRAAAWQYASRFLGLGVAHAHPGHYQAGNAMGQMLESSSLELLGAVVAFPEGDGVTGTYRSARFTLAEPTGPAKVLLDGHAALAAGVASKDGEATRYFYAYADLADVEQHVSRGEVDGCELTKIVVEGNGTITATVNPRVWFDLVDFTTADAGASDAAAELPADSDAAIGFVLGVAQLSAYTFSYQPE
jgi:hypothetical protein